MKKILFFLLLLSLPYISYSQKSKTAVIQPYSIANIKLGMSQSDFVLKYPDSISTQTVLNSTKTFFYDQMKINSIKVHSVIVKFFKGKLMMLSFRTDDSSMHSGLAAKYGYKSSEEYEDYKDGVTSIIGGYGKRNDYYDLFHVSYDNGQSEHFLMIDMKAKKNSDAEGF